MNSLWQLKRLLALLPVSLKGFVTRWACRYEVVEAVSQTLPAVIEFLEELVSAHDANVSVEAGGFFYKICSVNFISSLQILLDLLATVQNLSTHLQNQSTNIAAAVSHKQAMKDTLRELRREGWKQIWITITSKCEECNVPYSTKSMWLGILEAQRM